jgi:hypothetical protein
MHTIIVGDTVCHRPKHMGKAIASTADYTTDLPLPTSSAPFIERA